jgi:diketogulonate reductase-like aldo/keto reductase
MGLSDMRKAELPSGVEVPVLGQGTWHFGQGRRPPKDEMAALRLGIDLGMNLIDTAEMYGNGRSEELIGRAIAGRRQDVFLVSKVLPSHATRQGTRAACHASLGRLKTDCLDLYLLHWRGTVPLSETVAAFTDLQEAGAIRNWGVSNLALADLDELVQLPNGRSLATDQLLYNLRHRGIELDLLPWCRQFKVPVMAYTPIEQGRMLGHPALAKVAERHGATPAQVALAWIVSQDGLIAIPEAGSSNHVQENRGALEIHLTEQDHSELNHAFPVPTGSIPLEMG